LSGLVWACLGMGPRRPGTSARDKPGGSPSSGLAARSESSKQTQSLYYFGMSGFVCDFLVLFMIVWDCLGLYGLLLARLGLSWFVWACLGLSGLV
jgi:hypothetical protein